MTEHDRVRMERAKDCDINNRTSLEDALRGLQSTDDPSLVSLHDELMGRLHQLNEKETKDEERDAWKFSQRGPAPSPLPRPTHIEAGRAVRELELILAMCNRDCRLGNSKPNYFAPGVLVHIPYGTIKRIEELLRLVNGG